MSRRQIGSRVLWGADKIRAQNTDAALQEFYGPIDPSKPLSVETRPLTEYGKKPYKWNKATRRFHWRVGTDKRNKKGRRLSGSFCKVPDSERKLYDKRITQERAHNEQRKRRERIQGKRA